MKNFKIMLSGLIIVLFTFALTINTNKVYAQINENANNANVIDTITDDNENIFDTTANYKQLYDNLNGQGDWIQVTKGAVLNEMSEQNPEDVTYSEDPIDSTDQDYNQPVYVWRPYVTGSYSDWDPYCYGRWEFTYLGWIWISDYEWGWAPYHYGRWWYSGNYGWLWFPGRVWGPNWCSWRHHGGYVGWHPRGPRIWWRGQHNNWVSNHTFSSHPQRWTFIDKKNFTGNISKSTIISQSKNKDFIYGSKTISGVNSFTEKNKIYNYTGPSVSSISSVSGENITPKKIKATQTMGQTKVSDNTVNVYKSNKIGTQNNSTQIKPSKYINGNEVVTNTRSNENSKTVLQNQNSSRNENNAVNTNVQRTPVKRNSSTVYSNNDFYKVKSKLSQRTSTNNTSKTRNNNRRVNSQTNTNKSGNINRNSNTQNRSNTSTRSSNNSGRQHSNNNTSTRSSNNGSNNHNSTRSSNNGSNHNSTRSSNNGSHNSSHGSNNSSRGGRK